jgi:F0F1-type ATP synthase membrane subunit b/b'
MSDEKIPLSGEADYRFLSLVMSLATAAWSQLGKVPNPATQKIEKDVEQARISIEFLRMLQEKTEGNLSVKEQELLDNAVSDLELNFADEIRKAEANSENTPAGKGPEIIVPPGVAKGPEIIKPS